MGCTICHLPRCLVDVWSIRATSVKPPTAFMKPPHITTQAAIASASSIRCDENVTAPRQLTASAVEYCGPHRPQPMLDWWRCEAEQCGDGRVGHDEQLHCDRWHLQLGEQEEGHGLVDDAAAYAREQVAQPDQRRNRVPQAQAHACTNNSRTALEKRWAPQDAPSAHEHAEYARPRLLRNRLGCLVDPFWPCWAFRGKSPRARAGHSVRTGCPCFSLLSCAEPVTGRHLTG